VNSSCDGSAEYAGVVRFGFSATLSSCVFQGNSGAEFGANEAAFPVSVVLVDCVFDVANVTVISTALFHFSVQNSTYGGEPTWLPTCAAASAQTSVTATPVGSALPAQTDAIAGANPALGPAMVLAIGIGVPGLFLLVVVIIIAVKVSAERRRRIRKAHARVHFESAFMAGVKDKKGDGIEKDGANWVVRVRNQDE
jgi:hypothetical protein